jgi:hypothetical protein
MRLDEALDKVLIAAVDETTKKGLVEAQVMSQGTASLGQLASEDHPYAKRHGFPLRNPAIINEQSGDFLRDWERSPAVRIGDNIESEVGNFNPIADYLTQPDGSPKSKMFQRPIDQVVEAKMEVFLEDALTRRLKEFEDNDIII